MDRETRLDREFDPMIPEQFFRSGGRGALQPEKRLMMAVLEDAVAASLRQPTDRQARESMAWIASDDTSWPYAFLNVCEMLGLQQDAVRHALDRQRALRGYEAAAA